MDTDLLHAEYRAAVEAAGGVSAYGRLVGASKQAISWALRHGKIMPPLHVLKVEKAFGISRSRLRPDLYPPEEQSS